MYVSTGTVIARLRYNSPWFAVFFLCFISLFVPTHDFFYFAILYLHRSLVGVVRQPQHWRLWAETTYGESCRRLGLEIDTKQLWDVTVQVDQTQQWWIWNGGFCKKLNKQQTRKIQTKHTKQTHMIQHILIFSVLSLTVHHTATVSEWLVHYYFSVLAPEFQ